ncbi:YALIA101S05e05886g1_1 [Yarrowia lipolytica]|nr:Hypothetical protein YALI2_E01647g [Yarrowia lipolytica]SEI34589.1 YALIA101S05e05886g1_1 [Yarrowia lipolytica]VBB79081.1 Selenoprotein domain containing protein, putative [Yarrowia lipolytica]
MNAYPRVAIHFCTGCKWNLRAAWYLQELLSTFGNQLGEVALLPASSGTFVIELVTEEGAKPILLWDRKTNGGFPDSKDLKKLVRDVISPKQDLGHIDGHKGGEAEKKEEKQEKQKESDKKEDTNPSSSTPACTDCETGSCK